MIANERNPADVLSAPEEIAHCCRCGALMKTGLFQGRARRVCTACDYVHFVDPKVGVGVLLLHEEKILLVRRAMAPERGKWSLPAGFLDRGEDPAVTAARETKEETNLEVRIEALLEVYSNPPCRGGASIFLLYRATMLAGELRAGDDADDARFFSLDQLPELAFTSTKDAIRRLTDREETASRFQVSRQPTGKA